MKPGEALTERLRALQLRAQTLPEDLERVARAQVTQGVPSTVSVSVNRTATGVHVGLSGKGARAHLRRIRPRITADARAAIATKMKL